MSEVKRNIEEMISSNDILLFMKGDPYQPRCGFSATVIDILKSYKIEFGFVDVLEDSEVRTTLPEVSDWPTFPQLFVKGELIGGCDILTEMHEQGNLKAVLIG